MTGQGSFIENLKWFNFKELQRLLRQDTTCLFTEPFSYIIVQLHSVEYK